VAAIFVCSPAKIAATKESEAIISKAKAQADVIVNDAIEKARHLSKRITY
jgi:cell division septum initiation protein DivIVA